MGPVSPKIRQLADEYYRLRQLDDALRTHKHQFEALPWSETSQSGQLTISRRDKDGWSLSVCKIKGRVEVIVRSPAGEATTYCEK